jgi:hypothetical protein
MGGDDSRKLFTLEGNVTPLRGAGKLRLTAESTL